MRYALTLWSTNLKAAFALRTAFWMQAGLMLVNNLAFFAFWWVLFQRFEHVRGWRIEDVAVLFGVSAAGYGLAALLAGGAHDLARRIEGGDLDPMLTQPRSVLLQAASARVRPDGLGDVVSGLVLIAMAGHLRPSTVPIVGLAIVLSAATFFASMVLVHSLAFWLGRIEALARQVSEFLIAFSVYPPPLFQGGLKVLLFTVLPAGFISYLPCDLVRAFDGTTLLLAVAGTTGYTALAVWVFGRGLRQYASGSRFGVRD